MNDLLYMDCAFDYDDIKVKLLKHFPDINIEEASDDVHQYRLSIDLDLNDTQREKYYRFLIAEGYAAASLAINLLLRDPVVKAIDAELHKMVVQLLSEAKERKCTNN